MTSSLVSRNVVVDGRRTSIRLEPSFWEALSEIAKREECSINDICTWVHQLGLSSSFTASVRVFALEYFWRPEALQR